MVKSPTPYVPFLLVSLNRYEIFQHTASLYQENSDPEIQRKKPIDIRSWA
jgi:hypothetical protein